MTLLFYTTAGCHLCEQAEELLEVLKSQHPITVEAVDISTSEELVDLYGIRIPVVRNEMSGEEIGWPFGYDELANLV